MEPTTSKTPKTEIPAGAPTSGKSAKPAKKAKPSKESKPKKERGPKPDLVVFALRMSREERDRIHRAGGPGGATRLVRSAAIAIADGDRTALDQLLAGVKVNLKS